MPEPDAWRLIPRRIQPSRRQAASGGSAAWNASAAWLKQGPALILVVAMAGPTAFHRYDDSGHPPVQVPGNALQSEWIDVHQSI